MLRPTSVVDVGCGTGEWLAVFQEQGVREIFGLDGTYVDQAALSIPAERFFPCDLAQIFGLDRRCDLALSLEVGEHLPPTRADSFVTSLRAFHN